MCSSQRGRLVTALCILLATLPQLAQAQENVETSPTSIDSSSLDYYRMQSFEAGMARQRIALNHIGIAVQGTDGGYLVSAALEGYPAHKAGIERGDKILRVDEEPFHPIYSFNDENVAAIGFTASSNQYRLEYERQGVVTAVSIATVYENLFDSYRSAIQDSVQVFSISNKTVGYVRLWGLSRSTSDLFSLEILMKEFANSDGLVLDLRDSYGYLSSKHLNLFARGNRGSFDTSDSSNVHTATGSSVPHPSQRPFTRPIAVLINSETSGGAELLAYGLSKIERIGILGETSAGRIGTYVLTEEGLRYEPAFNTLIDEMPFEGIGVEPEATTVFPYQQSSRNDPQFDAAIEFLLGII